MANVPNLSVVRDPGKAKKLGRYELEECLGGEGSRETYRARVRGLAGFDRTFAVKCLRRRKGPVTSRTDPFLLAAKRVGSVIDARVARVLDTDVIDGAAVVVTEFVQGLDLDRFREWAQSSGELATGTEPAAEKWQRFVAYIGSEIARALTSMHALVPPFVHGGLSPRNVIVTSRGGIKVLDAGLAVAAEKGGDAGSQRAVPYAAPRSLGTDPMPSADVRALGAILFELAVGELPAPDLTGAAVQQVLAPAWPPMAELIATMLAEEPTSRPRARQVAEVLARHWSSLPEATITAELAALVRNFSAFVADSSPPGGVPGSPSADAPALEPTVPSTSGTLAIAPPSAAAIASGSFLDASDAATRVSPDSGYASAIFRALPADAAVPPTAPAPSSTAVGFARGPASGARGSTPPPTPPSRPGIPGKGILPTLPPAPKVATPPFRPLGSPLAPAKPRTAPASPVPSARTVIWSPGPAQALGIAPALLARTLAAPPPAPVAPMPVPPMPDATLPPAEEQVEPEPMAETAEWGAQALAALGSQAGVPVVLAPTEAEQPSLATLEEEAPSPVRDPTIEEAFSFAPAQPASESWAAPPPVSQAGPPALDAQAFGSPARPEMLEDELVDEETAPLPLSARDGGQAQLDEGGPEDATFAETVDEPAYPSDAHLEATAFVAEEGAAAPEEAEPEPVAAPAPAPRARSAGTRNALRMTADREAEGAADDLWQPQHSRTKRIVVVLVAAAALGAGAAALTIGPLGGKKHPAPPISATTRAQHAGAAARPPNQKAVAAGAAPRAVAAKAERAATAQAGAVAPARAMAGKGEPSGPVKTPARAAVPTKAGGAAAGAEAMAKQRGVEPEVEPVAGAFRVRIASKPPGARAWINGQERGETPLTVPLKPGSARIALVHAGYLTHQATLEVREGATIEATLKSVEAPMTGEARFRAECQTPGKLPIVVDGKETGILCPFSKMRVDPGMHTIGLLIPATGQVHQKEVTLRPGVRSVVFGD